MKVLVKDLRCVGGKGEMVMGGKEKGISDDTIRGICMYVGGAKMVGEWSK